MSKIEKSYKGRIKRNPDGFGFFICDDSSVEDIYIPKEEMSGVFSNDKVEVSLNRRKGRFGTRGKVLKVIERAADRFVGRLCFDARTEKFYLKDTAHTWGQKLFLEKVSKETLAGELVLVEVVSFPKLGRDKGFLGKVVSCLGRSMDPNTDNIRILHESSCPIEFSDKALKEARGHGDKVKESDKKSRKDLRKLPLITIDGVTAKDFDDAILVEKSKNGGYRLIVAIADVSHYVPVGSVLDSEAYEKGTSVYLANYVCPMLPEELSNGLCSLNPNVDRLCFCCEMTLSSTGEIQSYTFFEGLMKSHARVTYGEAQAHLEGDKLDFAKVVLDNISNAAELSEVLNKKRMSEGSIDFDVPAVKVLVDDTGEALDLVKEERIFAHRLIEELMLITNICASKFLESRKTSQLYRVHESPEGEDLKKLQKILSSFLGVGISKIKSSFDFQKISKHLQSLEQRQLASIAQSFALRSMKQAQYSSQNAGHFGLNFTHYAHFTSPIRRYPDLVIHRQIKSALKKQSPSYSEEDLGDMGVFLSAAEQRAVKAERKVTSIKKARFFEKFIGEDFEGYISSIAKFGVFVSLRDFPLDGLIKLDELSGDHFIYDEETWTLRGKRTGKTFRVGDEIKINVSAVSVEDGKIDFSLVSHKGQEKKLPFEVSSKKGRKKFSDKKAKSKKSFKPSRAKEQKEDRPPKRGKKNKSGSKKSGGAASLFSSSSSSRGLSFGKPKKKRSRKK